MLPELPYLRFLNGRQNDVPILAGWNADEGLPFIPFSFPHDTVQNFINAATNGFGAANLASFLQLYPAASVAQAAQSAQSFEGDLTIKYQTWCWANLQHITGHSPVFVYNFSFTSAYTPIATHTTEVDYVFGNFVPNPFNGAAVPSAQDLTESDAMETYWTNFARTANPDGPGVPHWPQYEGAGSQALQIGNVIQAGPEDGTARFEFLNQFRVNGLIPIGQH